MFFTFIMFWLAKVAAGVLFVAFCFIALLIVSD